MSVEDFITLCKTKITDYLIAEQIIKSADDCNVYVVWKDYWTIGATSDNIKITDTQRGIFGTSLDKSPLFDISYSEIEEKLYMNVLTITDSEEYSTATPQNNL